MEIHKILNNNVALSLDKRQQEVIVMGKGIAYQKKIGDSINKQKIDKVFSLSNQEVFNRFQELLTEIPIDYFDISNEIIESAKLTIGKKLNESLYLSLSDHIFSAITRFKQGISVKNALLWDIKRFYPDEYVLGLRALQLIKEYFDIQFPEDEAGFIALHIVNSQDQEDTQDIYLVTKIIQEVSNLVRYFFKIDFDEESVYFYRFISHLKFFAQRLISEKMHEDESDEDLLDVIKMKYKNAYQCVGNISKHIKNNYDYELTNEEKLYLTVHIHRVIYKN